jgi:hypothetical protein
MYSEQVFALNSIADETMEIKQCRLLFLRINQYIKPMLQKIHAQLKKTFLLMII